MPSGKRASVASPWTTCKLLKIIADERGTAGHELYLGMIKPLEIMKEMIERGDKPESRFDINAVMIGSEWCLITTPQEPFCDTRTTETSVV